MPTVAHRPLRCCAAMILFAGSAALAEWQPPTVLPGYTGTYQLGYPQVAIAENDGSVAVAWEEGGGEPWVAVRSGRSGGWQALQVGPAFGYRPQVAMNAAGDLATVWIGSDRISVRYRPAGGPWESAALLEQPTSNVAARVAINAAGDVLVAWVGRNEAATQYEVHAAFRPQAGPWPATGSFDRLGATDSFGDLAVALDDDGVGVAVWTTTYATVGGNQTASVLRASTRTTGGSWSLPTDLSPRGEEGTFACSSGLPVPFPDARLPSLALDRESGELAIAYAFDPTGIELLDIDGELGCGPYEADRGVRLAAGSSVSLPVGGADLGSWVEKGPEVSLADGTVAVAWRRCEENGVLSCEGSLQAGVAPLGVTPAISVNEVVSPSSGSPLRSFGVAATTGGEGFLVRDVLGSGAGWEMTAGVVAAAPVPLADGLSAMNRDSVAMASTAGGYAVAVLLASGSTVLLAENLPLIFRDGFESGGLAAWSAGGG